MPLPWESGSSGFAPWQIGQYFTDANGNTYQVYADPNSQSGYTLKKIDAAGNVTFTTGPTPNDPGAQARWVQQFLKTPEGKPYADSEAASAAQNTFNQNLQTSQLGVSQAAQRATAQYQQALVQQAREQLAFERDRQNQQHQIAQGQLDVSRGQLGVSQGQLGLGTLQLGAQLRGPRDVFAYDRMAGATSSNPILANAVSTWADLTNNRPTGMGAWQGGTPERASLGALAADFGGLGRTTEGPGSGGGGAATSATEPASVFSGGKQQTLAALDQIARNPQSTSANWWGNLNPTQREMAIGGWLELGHDPDSVLSRYGASRINQGLRGTRVA
jgi:hypothetical protein